MTVLPARCVCGGLNRVRNISLYDLSTDLSKRAGGCGVEVRYGGLRPCDAHAKAPAPPLASTRLLVVSVMTLNDAG